MKFVIFCEKLNDGTVKTYTPEELALFLQQFRAKDGEAVIKIRPYIPEEALVLNSKTGETRIVRAVDYCWGTVTLYNSDKPDTVYQQKYGYLPIKLEEWDIDEGDFDADFPFEREYSFDDYTQAILYLLKRPNTLS